MLSDQDTEELLQPVFDALRAAMREGARRAYEAGSRATVQAILQNATALLPGGATSPDERLSEVAKPIAYEDQARIDIGGEVARRAPKGLVDEVLDLVLQKQPGMTQEQVDAAVLEVDSRIAAKSVYNKLRAWEKMGRRFRRHRGLWYRVADIPAPWAESSSPVGETGGGVPPASLDL